MHHTSHPFTHISRLLQSQILFPQSLAMPRKRKTAAKRHLEAMLPGVRGPGHQPGRGLRRIHSKGDPGHPAGRPSWFTSERVVGAQNTAMLHKSNGADPTGKRSLSQRWQAVGPGLRSNRRALCRQDTQRPHMGSRNGRRAPSGPDARRKTDDTEAARWGQMLSVLGHPSRPICEVRVSSSQYCGGGPCGHPGCCTSRGISPFLKRDLCSQTRSRRSVVSLP